MDPEVRKLVCETCWRTVFSIDSFQAAWIARSTSNMSNPGGFTYMTPPWEQMQRSINLMCEWCDLVSEEIEFYHQHKTKTREQPFAEATFRLTVRFEQGASALCLQLVVEDSWTPTYLVHTAADDNAARYIAAREVVRLVDSTATYALAIQCINNCLGHERCPPPLRTTLPTRVIDCASPAWPRLFVSDGIEDSYVALSYVWGEDQPHKTTSKSLDSYMVGIDTRCIPKTIRDAMTVTQKLGLRYLWVDAFCIVQDSDDDKAREIARIRWIFRNAYITIIAASAHKVSEGFLHDRPAWYPAPNTLPFRCPDGTVGTMLLRGGHHAPSEPVNTRAWCLEERVLSPRALIYCSHTLQYECQTMHMNVNSAPNFVNPFDGVPRLPDCVFTPAPPGSTHVMDVDHEMNKAWAEVLGLYTCRALTNPKDRLIALSGVIEQFHRFWQNSGYVAGLWEHQIPGCFLWQNQKDRKPRPKSYRAPSWSWAAIDGEITLTGCRNTDAVCTVKRCEAVLARQGKPYGEVTGGVLVLSAMVRKAVWDPLEGELFEMGGAQGRPKICLEESRSERGEIGYVTADAVEEVSETTCEVFVAVLFDTRTTLLGLVLVPDTDGTGKDGPAVERGLATYRRVGFFTAPFCDKVEWLGTSYQLVRIV